MLLFAVLCVSCARLWHVLLSLSALLLAPYAVAALPYFRSLEHSSLAVPRSPLAWKDCRQLFLLRQISRCLGPIRPQISLKWRPICLKCVCVCHSATWLPHLTWGPCREQQGCSRGSYTTTRLLPTSFLFIHVEDRNTHVWRYFNESSQRPNITLDKVGSVYFNPDISGNLAVHDFAL